MSRALEKEKIWVPDRNRTYDLPNPVQALYPLSNWELMESEAIQCILASYLACILHAARIGNVKIVLYVQKLFISLLKLYLISVLTILFASFFGNFKVI